MASPLSLYEPLDVIGNGSFGIIRKVKRKSDGVIFARKELNFERMTERDRKQIVAEVNILKDLHHDNIVRYHDRYVDRDAGILYILMEYCGGGDLSGIIKQAQRNGRTIPEDTIWAYFMQMLLALNYCHSPSVVSGGSASPCGGVTNGMAGGGGSGLTRAASLGSLGEEVKDRRPQILHRDLKPDNIFLDENNAVKLGDFGLSKALPQTTMASTYVGTPYYMSPEVISEKAYDSKSDIWSLGCVVYELCALKPPFAEARTHSELSILVRNGRIPPLPKGYSPTLSSVIKAMLNLNPAMRPSASQLLQHERLTLVQKVFETEKLLATVKAHKTTVLAKERDLVAREATLTERESQLNLALSQKDAEIASLRSLLSTAEQNHSRKVREALQTREEELRGIVMRKEAELAARLAKREEEVMVAVNRREEDVARSWAEWERSVREEVTRAVDERMEWVQRRAEELERENERLEEAQMEVEARMEKLEKMTSATKMGSKESGKGKTPLEEVKNILAPLAKLAEPTAAPPSTSALLLPHQTPARPSRSSSSAMFLPPAFETPMPRTNNNAQARFSSLAEPPLSAMKGVILTHTGEVLPTPRPAELAKLFVATPKVALNFAQIFDFESDAEETEAEDEEEVAAGLDLNGLGNEVEDGYHSDSRFNRGSTPKLAFRSEGEEEATPKKRVKVKETTNLQTATKMTRAKSQNAIVASSSSGSGSAFVRPTRLRRPSIRGSTMAATEAAVAVSKVSTTTTGRANSASGPLRRKKTTPTTGGTSCRTASASTSSSTSTSTGTSTASAGTGSGSGGCGNKETPMAEYDLSDEENLPSPFLKRVDRERTLTRVSSAPANVIPPPPVAPVALGRKSGGGGLRALAVVNAAHASVVGKKTRGVKVTMPVSQRATTT